MTGPEYVCGLVFTAAPPAGGQLMLIQKDHPPWQAGRFNGPSGLIQPGEEPQQAMSRECAEETGIAIPPERWTLFLKLEVPYGVKVLWYAARADLTAARSPTPERVLVKPVEMWLQFGYLIDDLYWIIPLAQARNRLVAPAHVLQRPRP